MSNLTGSCLCGAVSFEISSDPAMIMNCHCTDCQKATGSVYGTNLIVSQDSLAITGTPAEYHHTADSGSEMTKLFCDKCGAQMFGKNSGRAGMMTVRAGCVDQKDAIKPGANIFCDSAVPTTALDGEIKRFPRMPG